MSNDQFSDLSARLEQWRLAERLADLRSAGARSQSGAIVTLPDDYDRLDTEDRDRLYLQYLASQMDPRD